MPAPLEPQLKADVLAAIRAQDGRSRNKIARDFGIAPNSVTKIAAEAGEADAFDRAQTEKGARAAMVDAKAKRAALVHDLLDDAQRFRERAWSEYTQVMMGPEGPEFVTTKMPPIRDQQAAYTSIGIAIDKAMKLDDADSDGGAAAGRTMVNDLFGAFALAHAQIVREDTEPAVDLTAPIEPEA